MLQTKVEGNKDLRLSVRLSKNDKFMLEVLCKHYNSNMSEIIVSMIKHHYNEITENK